MEQFHDLSMETQNPGASNTAHGAEVQTRDPSMCLCLTMAQSWNLTVDPQRTDALYGPSLETFQLPK